MSSRAKVDVVGEDGRREVKLWIVLLLGGAAVGGPLGAPDVALERLGPLGGSSVAVLVLLWAALSAWLDDDVVKARASGSLREAGIADVCGGCGVGGGGSRGF